MRAGTPVLAAAVGLLAGSALAQPAQSPPPLRLPAGTRLRLTLAGPWLQGYLARQDDTSVTLAFPADNPFARPPEMTVPLASVTRVELHVGQKRHTWIGAAIGAVVIGLTGFTDPVDTSGRCDYTTPAPCSRAEAVAIAVMAGALTGGVVGHFVKSDVWTPVTSEALVGASHPTSPLRLSVRL
jgi:hypothetical protein